MSERAWRFYIEDMLVFSGNVATYVQGLDQHEFESSGINYDATLRNIELIGEAARHVPNEIRDNYQDIPWRMIIATRNQLIHGYLGIDNDVLWDIINEDIPQLIIGLKKIT